MRAGSYCGFACVSLPQALAGPGAAGDPGPGSVSRTRELLSLGPGPLSLVVQRALRAHSPIGRQASGAMPRMRFDVFVEQTLFGIRFPVTPLNAGSNTDDQLLLVTIA